MKDKKKIRASDFYNGVWSRGLRKGRKDFGDLDNDAAFFDEVVSADPSMTVLDVGCGTGSFCLYLRKTGFQRVVGVDVSKVALDEARKKDHCFPFGVMEAGDLAIASRSVDLCVSFDVAEHVRDAEAYWREINRVLKPGGCYIFQTPNRCFNVVSETIRWKGFGWRPHHPSLQSYRSLNKKLKKAGFNRIVLYKRDPLAHFNLTRLPKFISTLMKIIPWTHLPFRMQTHFWGVAFKDK